LRKWFKDVVKSMEDVELKKSVKQPSNTPHYPDPTREIPQIVKIGLDTSWITSMFIKPEKVVIKRLDLEDPEEVRLIEKLQEDLLDQKLISKDLKNQLTAVRQEQKRQTLIQEEQIRKQEELERNMKKQHRESLAEQAKINVGIATILEMMMKKQQQP
jgi:hypothetical protein